MKLFHKNKNTIWPFPTTNCKFVFKCRRILSVWLFSYIDTFFELITFLKNEHLLIITNKKKISVLLLLKTHLNYQYAKII